MEVKEFNLDRLNAKKIRLGEVPIKLTKTTYPSIILNDGYLVDQYGNKIGTKGDANTKIAFDKILQEGYLDDKPRPVYKDFYEDAKFYKEDLIIVTKDGREIPIDSTAKVYEDNNIIEVDSLAHTLSVNRGIEFTYDLSKGESPLTSLRLIATKNSGKEALFIYQKESNDLVEFDEMLGISTWEKDHKINNWWKDWAIRGFDGELILNDKGHPIMGACYGETVRRRHMLYTEVIDQIRKNPDGRRNITNLWQIDDFKEPHALKPCAFLTIWNVRREWDGEDYLDMTMVQRSSDFATAGCINQVQYVMLQLMVARELKLKPGTFTWKPVNVQIYDRHIEQAITMLNRMPIDCKGIISLKQKAKKFEKMTAEDIYIKGYPKAKIKKKNPQLKFQLGI